MLTARAQIANLTRKMAASTSRKERNALASQITALLAKLPARAAMKKTSYRLEEEETVEDEDEEEEGGNETDREEEGDDDEKKASAAEEEEASAESEDDEKKAEDDKEPPGDKDDKKESKKASARLAALEAEVTQLRADAAKRAKRDAAVTLSTTLAAALRDKRITPAEHATLSKKDAEYVAHFLDARPKSIVLTPEEALRPLPKGSANVARASGSAPEAEPDLTPEMHEMLASIPDEKLRAQVVANWKAQTNGVSR
jgi:hypothetical protein